MSTEIIPNNEIASRAYLLWEQAGRPDGRDLEFWVQAEAEIHALGEAYNTSLGVLAERGTLKAAPPIRRTAPPGGKLQPRTKQSAESTPRRGASRAH